MPPTVVLTLLSRSYCHLCDEMTNALDVLADELGFALYVVDVDADASLEAIYGEVVPVLLHEGIELCRIRADLERVREYLHEIG